MRAMLLLASIMVSVFTCIGIYHVYQATTYSICVGGVAKAAVWMVENDRTTGAPPIDQLLHVSCDL